MSTKTQTPTKKVRHQFPIVTSQIDLTVEITPYLAHKMVNDLLQSLEVLDPKSGKQKVIPPQMMYNYTMGQVRKGKKPLIPVQSNGRILLKDFHEWVNKYITKLIDSTLSSTELPTDNN